MRTIGNILWLIPFGIQSFVPLALFLFGKEIVCANDLRDEIGVARAAA